MSLTVKLKFILATLTAIAMVLFLAGSSYLMLEDVIDELRHAQTASALLQNHMDGDMMHDAMRASVLKASLGLQTKNQTMIDEARQEIEEDGATFLKDIKDNLALELPSDIRGAIQKAEPALREYIDQSKRYVDAVAADAKSGTTNSTQLLPAFEKSFKSLETLQENITKQVEKYGDDLQQREEEKAISFNRRIVAVSIIAVLLTALIPVFAQTLIFKPLAALIEAMNRLSGGDRNVVVPYVGRADEIGEMSAALLVFQRNAQEKIRLEEEQEQQKAKAEADRRKAMLDLAEHFEARVGELVKNVAAAATELQATSSSMSKTSQSAVEQASSVAAASEQTAHNANTVAAATEELSASFSEINQRMLSSTQSINDAVVQTEDTAGHVKRLDEAARKIGEVVKLISDIAEQTNLLALNATIEAARAGDAGKGFAVVASEVKALANQTAKATGEVESQIRAIQSAVQQSSTAMTAVTGSIDKVRDISSAIAGAIEEQNTATLSIASNVAETSRASNEIKTNISGVLHAAEETGSAAGQVLAAAEELSRNGEMLSQQVERFLSEVRSAK